MITIYKYPLKIQGRQIVLIPPYNSCGYIEPLTTNILKVDMQNGKLCMWALVDTNREPQPVEIFVKGTGHDVTNLDAQHIGSVMSPPFVWHVFKGYYTPVL